MDDQADPWHDDASEPLLALIKPELKPGERLLWASRSDRPSPTEAGRNLRSGFLGGLFLVGLAAASGAIATVAGRYQMEEVGVGAAIVFGVTILCAPVFFLATLVHAISGANRRRRNVGRVYALTNSRAIIWEPLPRTDAVTVHTFPKGTIRGEHVRRLQFPDGSGDILFRNAYEVPKGFYGVADVRRVEELIRRFLLDPDPAPKPEPSYTEY